MCVIETPEYSIRMDYRGLLDIRTEWGGCLVDRGGLNEWIDCSAGFPKDQEHRNSIHWLQVGKADLVERQDDTLACEGTLKKLDGDYGGMTFRNDVVVRERWALMHVWRKYTESSTFGADDSVCFLAPPSRTWSFHAGGGESYDQITTPEGMWEPTDDPNVAIPVRLRACCKSTGWAAMMGSRGGFGLILLEYAPGDGGIIRATRPKYRAEIKFDEIEFQFVPGGPRTEGNEQTGTFVLVPARTWEEVEALHDAILTGEVVP